VGRMSFVFRRLLLLVPVAVGVTIIVFFMVHLIPGDPARTILGIHATPHAIAILHREWGLNRPLLSQYWLFIDRLLHGDLGQSLIYGQSAAALILGRLPATLWLIIYSAVLAVIISVPLAMLARAGDQADIFDAAWLAVIAAFMWMGAGQALRATRVRERLPGLQARALARRAIAVPASLPLAEAIRRADAAQARALVIVDHEDKPIAIVNETAVMATPPQRRPWIGGGRAPAGLQIAELARRQEAQDRIVRSGAEPHQRGGIPARSQRAQRHDRAPADFEGPVRRERGPRPA